MAFAYSIAKAGNRTSAGDKGRSVWMGEGMVSGKFFIQPCKVGEGGQDRSQQILIDTSTVLIG